MGCGSCTTQDGKVAGCNNNGGCLTGGCNKMNVFDWLSNMEMPTVERFNVVEVRFKGGRKEFFRNNSRLELFTGDAVVVDVPNGHHIGYVSLQGELVRLQMQKKKVKNDNQIRNIYRVAHERDLNKFQEVQQRETPTLYRTRQIINDLKLSMKLSDVEFQADNSKATFFYSAEDRVDFRELIKILASEFRIRVEMRANQPETGSQQIRWNRIMRKGIVLFHMVKRFQERIHERRKVSEPLAKPQQTLGAMWSSEMLP